MKILTKEKYGDIEKLLELGKNKKNNFTTEQLLDSKLKNKDGENRDEVTKRMEEAFYKVFNENIGKKIAIVSHGAAIIFLLMKWCKLNNNKVEFKGKEITLNSPGVIKLEFKNKEFIKLEQII